MKTRTLQSYRLEKIADRTEITMHSHDERGRPIVETYVLDNKVAGELAYRLQQCAHFNASWERVLR